MIKYEKSVADHDREVSDLARSPIMRFLKNQGFFKFNIGDVVIKQSIDYHRTRGTGTGPKEVYWKTETISGNGAPKKFVYVFENELGIGYLKQLRVDGSGFTSQLICTANFDPDNTRFLLDPDYVDHMLVGEEGFQYNKEYLNNKSFRNEAIEKNTELLVPTRSFKKLLNWYHDLKPGDVFWLGETWDDLVNNKYMVNTVTDNPIHMCPSHVAMKLGSAAGLMKVYRNIHASRFVPNTTYSSNQTFTVDHFYWRKVSMTKPFPLKDEMCGQQK